MLKKEFLNIAYQYYPKGISNISQLDLYRESIEFKRLMDLLNGYFENKNHSNAYDKLYDEFKKHDILSDIRDVSLITSDRCLTFEKEIFTNKKLIKINIYLSVVVPYYLIFVSENKITLEPYRWITLPKRNKRKERFDYNIEINLISKIIESIFKYNKFPDGLEKEIIPDLSYQDVRMGEFNFFNAFFMDDNKF